MAKQTSQQNSVNCKIQSYSSYIKQNNYNLTYIILPHCANHYDKKYNFLTRKRMFRVHFFSSSPENFTQISFLIIVTFRMVGLTQLNFWNCPIVPKPPPSLSDTSNIGTIDSDFSRSHSPYCCRKWSWYPVMSVDMLYVIPSVSNQNQESWRLLVEKRITKVANLRI